MVTGWRAKGLPQCSRRTILSRSRPALFAPLETPHFTEMKLFIVDDDYPSSTDVYADVFAHVRVKAYAETHTCVVGSLRRKQSYTYEGIRVEAFASVDAMHAYVQRFTPDVILVHFAFRAAIDGFLLRVQCRIIVWVHGCEALGWYRRLFNLRGGALLPRPFYRMVRANVLQLLSLRRLIRASNGGKAVEFVFVSRWMKRICETDTLSRVIQSHIIPNPIDNRLFRPMEKSEEQRRRILMIRPFDSKKYAVDIAIEAIELIQKYPWFKDASVVIYGRGEKFAATTRSISCLPNVKLHPTFIPQNEIPTVHADAGIFLCPTRQDAQGVSMCEAMSSGLVPVTSENTAIPEFVTHGVSGFMARDAHEIAMAIDRLVTNPNLFCEMSRAASRSIIDFAGIESVIRRELALIEGGADR